MSSLDKVLERVDGYKDEMIRVLGESISFPSTVTALEINNDGSFMPFGKGVHDALVHILDCGSKMGFEAVNVDNYAGYIQFSAPDDAPDKKRCDIVCHADVVPDGDGWTNDPHVMIEKDGVLYGRGTSDDKGPMVASLYAMKALKDEGIVPKHDIRLVIGLNEEVGEESIIHYVEKCGHPDMGFTPDGEFPIVHGEMGILLFDLAQKLRPTLSKDDLRLSKLEAGEAHNMVPRQARAVLAGDKNSFDMIAQKVKTYAADTGYNIKARRQGSSLVIEAEGIAAHGAHPELGLNALSIMMEFLGGLEFPCDDLTDFISFYNEHIGFDLHGERIGCKFEDNPSGPLIFNVGKANISEELANITVNIRYPVTYTDADVISGIESALEGSSIGIITGFVQAPIYMDLDNPMVKTMLKAYVDETGDTESKPIVQGGGSYAKMVNNILAFGALLPDEENTMHQADERFRVESFMKMTRIYARTLLSLCCE